MLLPFVPQHYRRPGSRPRRIGPSSIPSPPPAAVTVAAVIWIDSVRAVWRFSSVVVAVTDTTGLLIAGQETDAFEGIDEEGGIVVTYSGGIDPEQTWAINANPPGPAVAVTFENGGTLVLPESGPLS